MGKKLNYSYFTRTLDKVNFVIKMGKYVLLTINHVEIKTQKLLFYQFL